MNICKNCKHWDFDSDDWRVAIMRRDPKDAFGLCQLLSTYDQEEAAALPAMGSSFSEGIGADFITLPTFGCNEFVEGCGQGRNRTVDTKASTTDAT